METYRNLGNLSSESRVQVKSSEVSILGYPSVSIQFSVGAGVLVSVDVVTVGLVLSGVWRRDRGECCHSHCHHCRYARRRICVCKTLLRK